MMSNSCHCIFQEPLVIRCYSHYGDYTSSAGFTFGENAPMSLSSNPCHAGSVTCGNQAQILTEGKPICCGKTWNSLC
jgi:hypothetical protein